MGLRYRNFYTSKKRVLDKTRYGHIEIRYIILDYILHTSKALSMNCLPSNRYTKKSV